MSEKPPLVMKTEKEELIIEGTSSKPEDLVGVSPIDHEEELVKVDADRKEGVELIRTEESVKADPITAGLTAKEVETVILAKPEEIKKETIEILEGDKKIEVSLTDTEKAEVEQRYKLVEQIAIDRMAREQKQHDEKWGAGKFGNFREKIFGTTGGKVGLGALKVVGGTVAMLTGASGHTGFFSPLLFGKGAGFIGEGAIDILTELKGGRGERKNIQQKSGEIENEIQEQMAALHELSLTMPKAEFEELVGDTVKGLEARQTELEADRKKHYSHELYRTAASKVASAAGLGIATACYGGIPLGIHNFGGMPGSTDGSGHAVWATVQNTLLGHGQAGGHGLDFMYHGANEAANVVSSNPLWQLHGMEHAVNQVGAVSHTMGGNIFQSLGQTGLDRVLNSIKLGGSLAASAYLSYADAKSAFRHREAGKATAAKPAEEVKFAWKTEMLPGTSPVKDLTVDEKAAATSSDTVTDKPGADSKIAHPSEIIDPSLAVSGLDKDKSTGEKVSGKTFEEVRDNAAEKIKIIEAKGEMESPEDFEARSKILSGFATPIKEWVESVKATSDDTEGELMVRETPADFTIKYLREKVESNQAKKISSCIVISFAEEKFADPVLRESETKRLKDKIGLGIADRLILTPFAKLPSAAVRDYANNQALISQDPTSEKFYIKLDGTRDRPAKSAASSHVPPAIGGRKTR